MNTIIDKYPAVADLLDQRNNWIERLERAVAIKQAVADEVQKSTSRVIAGINGSGAGHYCRQVDVNCWAALPRLVGYAQLLDGKRLDELESRLKDNGKPFVRSEVIPEAEQMERMKTTAIEDSAYEIVSNLDWIAKTSSAAIILRNKYSLEYCVEPGFGGSIPRLTVTGQRVIADIDRLIYWLYGQDDFRLKLQSIVKDAIASANQLGSKPPVMIAFDQGTIKLFKSSMQFNPTEEFRYRVNQALYDRKARIKDSLRVA